jgi:hypothetical protein
MDNNNTHRRDLQPGMSAASTLPTNLLVKGNTLLPMHVQLRPILRPANGQVSSIVLTLPLPTTIR